MNEDVKLANNCNNKLILINKNTFYIIKNLYLNLFKLNLMNIAKIIFIFK